MSDVQHRRVLEVGSFDVNGSVRSIFRELGPAEYVGVDLEPGPGVDVVCRAEALLDHFGPARFDVVITTEMLEHVREWRAVVHNLKGILAPDGVLLVTTRSRGFPFHGYPHDFWRYEIDDLQTVFGDLEIERVEADPLSPGVFFRARRPVDFDEVDLKQVRLYSIVRRARASRASALDVMGSATLARLKPLVVQLLPDTVKDNLRDRLSRRPSP